MAEKKRILLVDDEPVIAKMVERRLLSEGFDVLLAADGEAALAAALKEKPDLVLLDIMLPGIDGYEVCSQLKAAPDLRHIPIILFTALGQEKNKKKGQECGADAFLAKPFRSQDLLDTVLGLLGG